MKKDNKMLIIVLIVIVIIIGLWVITNEEDVTTVDKPHNNVTENKVQKAENKVTNKAENKVENKVENRVANNDVVENTIKNELVENTISNVTATTQSEKEDNDKKAINMVKQDWGEDASVTFKIDEKKENGKYVVSVVDKSTTAVLVWYDVDVKNNTIQVR